MTADLATMHIFRRFVEHGGRTWLLSCTDWPSHRHCLQAADLATDAFAAGWADGTAPDQIDLGALAQRIRLALHLPAKGALGCLLTLQPV